MTGSSGLLPEHVHFIAQLVKSYCIQTEYLSSVFASLKVAVAYSITILVFVDPLRWPIPSQEIWLVGLGLYVVAPVSGLQQQHRSN